MRSDGFSLFSEKTGTRKNGLYVKDKKGKESKIEGDYPKWRSVIPTKDTNSSKVDVQSLRDFLSSVKANNAKDFRDGKARVIIRTDYGDYLYNAKLLSQVADFMEKHGIDELQFEGRYGKMVAQNKSAIGLLMPVFFEGTGLEELEAFGYDIRTDKRGERFSLPEIKDIPAMSKEEISRYKSVGKGVFGERYDQFRGNPYQAAAFLMGKKSGEAIGVFNRPELGDIDLPWGNHEKKRGLEHIIIKHINTLHDFENIGEAMRVIDDVIKNGEIIKDKPDKIILQKDGNRVVVSKNVRDEKGVIIEENKNWVVTAYDKGTDLKKKQSSTSTFVPPESAYEGRAVTPDAVSDSKGRKNPTNTQGKGQRFSLPERDMERDDEYKKAHDEMQRAKVANSYDKGIDVNYSENGKTKIMRLHTPVSDVENLKATAIKPHSMSRDDQKRLYQSFKPETNVSTGETVEFYTSAFGKNHRENGLFEKIIPQIRELFKESKLIYSEPEQLAGETRRDGTNHKVHRGITGYGNYLNKANIDGKEYYVRFTVQRKKNESGLHSSFVSNVELYNNPVAVAYNPSSNGGRRLDYDRITDAKLKTYFEKSKENANKFSQLTDNPEYTKIISDSESRMREILDEVKREKGYSDDSSYQGSLSFNGASPSRNAYFETKEERAEAFREGDFEQGTKKST